MGRGKFPRNWVSTTDGMLDVHVADVHTELLNLTFGNYTGIQGALTSVASSSESTLNITSSFASQIGSGDVVNISEYTITETDHIQIVAASGNAVDIDRQLEYTYTTSAVLEKVFTNLATSSLSNSADVQNPVIFKIQPPFDEVWHILRLNVEMEDATEPFDNLFGGMAALANGVVVKENKSQSINLTNWKKNGDIKLDAGVDVIYTQKKTGGTNYGVTARWSPIKVAAIVRLDGAAGESLDLLVQDDIDALIDMHVRAQGHKEIM